MLQVKLPVDTATAAAAASAATTTPMTKNKKKLLQNGYINGNQTF